MNHNRYLYLIALLSIGISSSFTVKGQGTCSSSALAPVFSQTFGQAASNNSKTSAPSGFNTNYSFQSSGALNDGRYIVTPRVQNSGRNDWAVGNDHTGNSNGNMFLVNAGTGGSVFFTQQVDDLCPGSTYNFSAWLANVNTTSHTLPICGSGYVYPNVTFNIKNTSGTVLATYNTGNIPLTANRTVAPNWLQYGFSFALPSGTTSLVLEMVDAYGGQPQCGNDLAIDDILFTACTPTATVSFTTASTICAGTSTTINAAISNNPYTTPAYQWQKSTDGGVSWSNIGTAGTTSNYTINSASSTDGASYRVIVGPDVASLTSSTCVTASASISLSVASVKLNDDVIECNNGITSYSASDEYYKVLYSNTNAGNSYLWSVSSSGSWSFQGAHNPSSQYPRFQFNSSAAYSVSVQFTTNGVTCSDTQVVFKNAVALASILNSKDTSICYSTNTVNLSGSISYVTNNYSWSTSGTGTFSNANALNPTYTPSLADKTVGLVKLYFTGTSTYNATGNCGTNTSKDSMILRIYPNNLGTDTTISICSNQSLTYTPSAVQAGSTFLWTSSFTTGSGSGNTANGSGNISDVLINASTTSTAVVRYNITPYYAGCAGTPFILTANINPNPAINITNNAVEICTGTATNIQFTSSLAGSSFTWISSVVSGTASGLSSSTTPSATSTITNILSNNSTSNAVVRYKITTISANGCTSIDSTDVTVRPNPTIATAGTDQLLCNLNSTQLNANTPVVGTGNWTLATGPSSVTFSNATSASSIVSGLVPGTYVFVWSIANNPCTISRDSVSVIISPETVAGTLSSNANVCYGTNTGTFTLTGYTGNIIRWESSINNGGSWTSIANTSNTYTFTNLTSSTIYRAVVQSGSCSIQFSNTVSVTVDPLTVPGILSGTATVCSGSNSGTVTLTGYTGNIIRWESSTDGGSTWPTSYPINTNTYTFNNLTQTTTFRAVVQSGTCAIEYSNAITITVSPITVPGILSSNATVCATGNNGTLTLNTYTGIILQWEFSIDNGGSWSTISNTTNTLNYSNLTTSTQYRVSVQSGVCPPLYSNVVTITVVPPVELPNAGSDFGICNVAATSLNATVPSSGSGSWSLISGPSAVTFTNAADAHTTVNGLTTGIYLLEWTVSNGVCTSIKDTVQLTVYPATIPGTLSGNNTVCATSNNGTLTLTGYTSTILNWESSIDNGASWITIANTTNTLNYNNLSSTTQYRVSVQSGVCAPQYSNIITITVLPAVTTANAGTDQQVCFTTAAILAGNTPVNGTGTWTVIPGAPSAVTFTNANNPSSTVNGLVVGTYQFVWTISNGTCADSRDTVSLTVDPQTVPGTLSASNTVCATSNTGILTLTGYTSTILNWESSIDNGASWITIANTTNTLNYNNLSTTTQYRVSVQSGVCAPQYSNIITITVLPAVTTANAGADQQVCFTTAAILAGNTPVNGTGTWTVVPGAPSAVTFTNANNPTSTVNGLVVGTYQFVWTISNGTCADSRDTVSLTVDPQTVPGTLSASNTVCATSNNGTLTLSGFTSSILNWESSIDNGASWITIANTTNTLNYNNLSSTTQYRVSVQSGVCAPQYSNIITITVLPAVTTANAGADQQVCFTTAAILAGNTPVNGTGTWSVVPGAPSAVSFTNANNPTSTVNGLVVGSYQFVWTISNGTCADSRDTVSLTVDPQTVPGTLSASNTVCATSNNGTLTLSGFTSSILNWESSIDNGASWITIANTTNTLNYNNLSTTTQYRASVQSGVCAPQYSNIITITVLSAVTTANAGTDQALCNVTGITLGGNTPTSGTGTWTVLAGAPSTVTFTNAANPSTTVSGLVAGTYQFVWTISNGTCDDSKDTVQVIIHPPSVPGNITAEATVCATANNGTLTLNGFTGNIQRWEYSTDYGTTWTSVVNTTNTLDYTNLSATTTYRAAVQNQNCPVLYTNLNTITVLQPVTPANAGPDTTFINGVSSYTLSGNMPTSGTGTWSVVPGATSTLNFSSLTNPRATITGLDYVHGAPPTDGKYLLVWTISNGYCAVSSDTMQITVQPPTNPGVIGPDAVVCTGSNNGTLQLTDYLGTILQWESSTNNGATWTIIASTVGTNQDTYTYNNLTQTTLFRALVKNGVGAELYSGIAATITVLELVTPSNAGSDQLLCNTTSSTLAGNSPTSGMGTWSVLPGSPSTPVFSNIADPNTVISGLTIGTYQFVWTISNGICSDSKDTVTVTIQPPTIAGSISADNTVCITNNSGLLTFSGFVGNIVQGEYSIDNGITWLGVSNTANQSTFSYTNLTQTTQFRGQVKNGVCPALFTNIVTVTVLPEVTPANAGVDQALCNVTAAALNANTPTSGMGIWTVVPGAPSTVSFTNAADPTTTVNGLVHGTYRFIWTISNTLCASSSDTVEIYVAPPTIAGSLVASATVCANNNTDILTLSGNNGNIIRWEFSIDNGGSWTNISNTTSTYTYNNLNTTTAYRALNQNEICPSLYSNVVTITVIPGVTTANAGIDQVLCNVSSATLNANTPSSGTGTWSVVTGAPSTASFTNANDPATTVNGLVAGTYQFIWTIANGTCANSVDTVQVYIAAPTVAGNLVAAATVCATNNTDILTLSGNNGNIIRWEFSIDNGGSWTNISNTSSTFTYNNLNTTTTYRALNQNEVCPSLYSNQVTITVIQPVTTANAGTDQVLCNVSSATLNANTPSSGTGTWSVVTGAPSTVSFTNPNDPTTTVNGLVAGTYQFIWTIANGTCANSVDTVQVYIAAPTVAGNLVAAATVCATNNTDILTLSGNNGNIIRWEFSVDNGSSWTNISNTSNTLPYNNLNTTTTYRALNQNEVCPSLYSNVVTITVIQPVTTANAGTDQVLCNVSSATLNANTPSSGTGTWSVVTGAPSVVSFTNATDPNTTVNGLVVGTYQFIWTIANGTCANSADTVQVIIHPQTVAGSLIADATVCATANSNILSLSGNTGDIVRWESSINNGSSWNNIANTTNTLTYTNLNITTTYRVFVQSGPCSPLYSNNVTITVLQPVTIANAGADQILCNAVSTVLNANRPTSGTGTWSYLTGPSTVSFANAADPNTAVSGLTIGTYSFIWTITNNLCIDSKDTVQVTIDPITVPGTLSSNATVCSGANTGTLNLTGTTGNILHWEYSIDNGSTWSILTNTTNSHIYTNLTTSTLFRVLVKNSVCATSYSNIILITVMQPVTTAVAGINQTLCNSNSTRLNGNTPSSGVGVWVQATGPTTALFENNNLASTNVSGLNTGDYSFMWVISNGICPASTNTVQVRIDPPTSSGILSNDDTVCTNLNSGNLSINGYTGSIIRWESSIDNGVNWSVINTTSNSHTYENLTSTTRFRVLVQSGVCASLYSNTITITVNPLTVGGNIAANDTVCVTSNNGTLYLTNYVGDLIRWESSTDLGNNWNLINHTGDQYSFTNLLRSTMFRVMVQSGVCSAAFSDSVTITVDSATVAGTLSGVDTVCYNNNNGNIILSGKLGTIVQWEASENNGATWNVLSASSSDTLQYNNLTRTTLYRALVKNGTCAIMYSNPIEIAVVLPVTPANAGTDIVVCNAATSTTLNGNTPSVGTGLWRLINGPNTASIADPTNPSTTISGLVLGTYQFVWEISNGVCVNSSDTVTVTVDQSIANFTLSGVNNCGNTVYQFNDKSQSNFGITSWKWSIAPGDTVYQKEHSVTFTSEGTYTMSLTIESTTGCVNSLQAQFTVAVFEFPQVDIDAIRDICKGQLTQLSPIINSKDSIAMLMWNLGNGSRSTDSVINVRYIVDGQYTVRLVASTVNRCFDSAYKAMTVHPLPVINITPNSTICKGDSIQLNASGAMHYIWFDQLNNITATGPGMKTIRPAGTTSVRVIGYDEHGCSEIKSTSVRVIQPLKMFTVQGDTLCIGESKQLVATGANTYKWYPEIGLNNTNIPNPIAKPTETTTYNVIGKDAFNCFADTTQIRVVVGRPTPISIGRDTIITAGTSFQLNALPTNSINAGTDQIRKWRWGGSPNISCITCPTPEVKLSNDACISCTVVNNYGCVSTDTICIKTLCPTTELFVPNAFSPDGDGINDLLVLQGKGVKMIKSFRIYNRWGQLVFEKANFSPGDPAYAWNGTAFGKAVSPDVFVYVAEVICEKGLPTTFKGNITILK